MKIENLFFVKRPQDSVIVSIMMNRMDGKFHFVNLTKSHICPCAFDTVDDAINDMKKLKTEGKIISFECI